MSWLKSVPHSGDDVFDEEADEMLVSQREWGSTMDKRVKDGYRDGVEAGREASLQLGFNQGYKEGVMQMLTVGQLKGVLSALQTWCQIHEQYREHLQKIQSLWDQVVHHEKHMLETVRVGHKPTHLGDLADSVEDMDIGEKSFRQHENRSRDGAGEMKEDCLKNPDIVSCKEQESICVRSSSSNMTTYTIEQLLQKTSHLVKELDLPVELTEYISHLEH